VVTVPHVLDTLYKLKKFLKYKGIECKLAAFRVNTVEETSAIDVNYFELVKAVHIGPFIDIEGYIGPADLDVAVCKSNEISNNYLKIRMSSTISLFQNVHMCGFPGTWQSMLLENEQYGVRLSPVWQTGQIAGLMPFNGCLKPYALQTDIMATGGSSGSPIVDPSNG
jgi:hypothetical protein